MLANLMVGISKGQHEFTLNLDLLRYMVLNSVRSINMRYKKTHGRLVIATESDANWRKSVFPYYKANRKRSRDESTLDWGMIFESFGIIVSEMREYMPYPVVSVSGAEADDIIGHLATRPQRGMEPVVIVSGDKDFIQLQRHPGVSQWNHVMKKEVSHPDPAAYLKEKIIRGDVGDGVPNFLSDDDVLVATEKKQKPIFAAKVEGWLRMTPEEICEGSEYLLRNWRRNELLVDLSRTPENLRSEIDDKYEQAKIKPNSDVFTYFVNSGLKKLTPHVQDF